MSAPNPRLKFYEILKDFKDAIISLLGDSSLEIPESERAFYVKKFNNIHEKILLVKSSNSKLAIEVFYKSLFVPYGRQIISQDDQFFLSNRDSLFGEEVNTYGLSDLIEGISKIWPQLPTNNQRTIWRYILALCKVADLSMGENHFEMLKTQVTA